MILTASYALPIFLAQIRGVSTARKTTTAQEWAEFSPTLDKLAAASGFRAIATGDPRLGRSAGSIAAFRADRPLSAAPRIYFSVAVRIQTLEPNSEASCVPNRRSTAFRAGRILRRVQIGEVILPPGRRSNESPECLASGRTLDSQHTFVGVAM